MEFDDFFAKTRKATPKKRAFDFWFEKLLTIAVGVFKYQNLPANLPVWEIEKRLILWGRCCVFDNKLYGVITSFGGTSGVDIYNNSNKFNYAQAVIGSSREPLTNNVDCVIMYGSSVDKLNGFSGAIGRRLRYYADILSDIDISRRMALINGRAINTITAKSDNALNGLKTFYSKLQDGELFVPKIDSGVLDSTENILKTTQSSATTNLQEYDVATQNTLKQFYSDFGIAYGTEKRERMITDEVTAEQDALDINLRDMLQCRQDGIAAINTLFGTSIIVGVNNDVIT